MGSWGQKAFENDDAADWLADLNRSMQLGKRLKKDIKQKKDVYVARAAIEYMIRSEKTGLLGMRDFEELTPLAMERIKQIKTQLADPDFWAWDSDKPLPQNELKEVSCAIRKSTADLNSQLKYLQKAEADRLDMKRGTLSKAELSAKFQRIKKEDLAAEYRKTKAKKKARKKK